MLGVRCGVQRGEEAVWRGENAFKEAGVCRGDRPLNIIQISEIFITTSTRMRYGALYFGSTRVILILSCSEPSSNKL